MRPLLITVLAASIAVSACATTPRAYVPTNPTTTAEYQADFAACAHRAHAEAAGGKDRLTQVAAGGAGAGVGTALVVGTASATVTTAALSAGAGVASAGLGTAGATAAVGGVFLLPVALGAAAGVGIARSAIRRKKETALKDSMRLCMAERGHQVEGWKRAPN